METLNQEENEDGKNDGCDDGDPGRCRRDWRTPRRVVDVRARPSNQGWALEIRQDVEVDVNWSGNTLTAKTVEMVNLARERGKMSLRCTRFQVPPTSTLAWIDEGPYLHLSAS